MKHKITQTLAIPSGINCSYAHRTFSFTKGSITLKRAIDIPNLTAKVESSNLILECEKSNRVEHKKIMSLIAHIKNIFDGLETPFVYKLESANVHFPMTLKVTGNVLSISNFLGEKTARKAVILPTVKVDIAGPKITVSSPDVEAAGQTAANIEKATRVPNRDRRIFQDGIYITEKPGRRM